MVIWYFIGGTEIIDGENCFALYGNILIYVLPCVYIPHNCFNECINTSISESIWISTYTNYVLFALYSWYPLNIWVSLELLLCPNLLCCEVCIPVILHCLRDKFPQDMNGGGGGHECMYRTLISLLIRKIHVFYQPLPNRKSKFYVFTQGLANPHKQIWNIHALGTVRAFRTSIQGQ